MARKLPRLPVQDDCPQDLALLGKAEEVWMIADSLSLTAPRSKRSVRGANNDDAVPISRVFKTTEFGYQAITVERPVLDENGQPVFETRSQIT